MVRTVGGALGWALILLVGALSLYGPDARAQSGGQLQATQEDEATGKVQVDVMVVHATNSGQVDPRLQDLQRQLDHTRYTGFEVLSTSSEDLGQGQVANVTVVGGRKVKVRLIERTERQARVRIELYKGNEKKLDTTVSIPRGRTFLVAGPKYEEGVLIFPITVTY